MYGGPKPVSAYRTHHPVSPQCSPPWRGENSPSPVVMSLELPCPKFRGANYPLSHPPNSALLKKWQFSLPVTVLLWVCGGDSWWWEAYEAHATELAPPSKNRWRVAGLPAGSSVRKEQRATCKHLCSQVWVRKTGPLPAAMCLCPGSPSSVTDKI